MKLGHSVGTFNKKKAPAVGAFSGHFETSRMFVDSSITVAVPGPGKASNQARSKLDQGRASSRGNGCYLHLLRKLSVFDVGSCGHFPVTIPHIEEPN